MMPSHSSLAPDASMLPVDVSAALRLKEYLPLVRELSLQRSPRDLVRVYRARSQLVVPHDHNLTVTRLGTTGCEVRVLASSLTGAAYDPWEHPDEPPRISSGLVCQLMEAGRPVKVDHLVCEPDDPIGPYLKGMNSLIACPIFNSGHPLHLVMLLREPPAAFTLDELSTLLLTANLIGQTSFHSELAQRLRDAYAALDREFRVVGEIQRALLPRKLPAIPGVSLAAYYETSTRAGGDYYDFFPLPDDQWGLLIADVAGHGAPAAVLMARMHALLHAPMAACPSPATTPAEVLRAINRALVESTSGGYFVTALYGVLDPRERTLRYTNAGHNPPRWLRAAEGRIVALAPTDGLPLAIVEPVLLGERVARFEPGDRLLLYTDGITETFNGAEELFGVERLDAALQRCQQTPQAIVDGVIADLRAYSNAGPPADDRTLLALAFE